MASFAQLGIQIDSNADQAASSLENLAAAGAKAEKSTERLSKASSDLSAEQQKINARAAEMAAQDARRAASAQKANNSIRDQQQELAKLIGQIDPTVAALDRLDERERKLAAFRRSGALDVEGFQRYNDQLKTQRSLLTGVDTAAQRAGMSQRQYANNLRITSMQLTDIGVGLATGQPFYMVALQQGGQLRDIWGGLGNAAKALATSVLSLVNPFTVAAAAVGTLGVAWYQAGRQQEDLEKALISSGRYAASSSEELNRLADAYDNIDGVTRGKALEALTQVAASGRLTGEQFRLATESALRWSAVTGDSVDTITSKFNDIARDPVNALLKLNETERFLTGTQYERVKALQEEGRFQDAATEAARIYADTVNGRATEIEASLGLVSTAWKNIKNETGEAWDAVVTGINRAQGPLQAFADRVAGLSELQRKFVVGTIGALSLPAGIVTRFGGNAFRGVSSSVDSTAGSGDTAAIDSAELKRQQDAAKATADRARSWDTIVASTDKAKRNQIELQRIQEAGVAAGVAQVDIDRQKDAYLASQVEKTRKVKENKTEEDKAAVALLRNYTSITEQLERQIALTGDNTNLGRINYDITNGNLKGLGADEQARLRNLAQTEDSLSDFEAIYGSSYATITAITKESTDLMAQYGIQAARNIQTSFADFLFDPFADGLGGMVEGFAKSLQRMAAEAASAKVFQTIGSFASGYTGAGSGLINSIGSLIAGGKAEGGYTGPGGKYEPRGIVHAGEVVWSQRDVAAVGGPKRANSMRPTSGYANGGIVGQSSGSMYSGKNVQFNVKVTNAPQGMGADARATPNQMGGFDIEVKMKEIAVSAVADDLARGGIVGQAGQSRYDWNTRV